LAIRVSQFWFSGFLVFWFSGFLVFWSSGFVFLHCPQLRPQDAVICAGRTKRSLINACAISDSDLGSALQLTNFQQEQTL
jgi:hypothetical protein